ncbi:MAG: acetyl-CoA carboxylase biotin carboxyl carrier protein [Neomegalonema sp.]|nr:acetyl-CoA carboxylase biotin carboxyl carrier protein [Neomegalonema sp.]
MTKADTSKKEVRVEDLRRQEAAAADVAFIEALAKLLRENDLTEIEVEREFGDDDELKVRLSRGVTIAHAPAPASMAAAPLAAPVAAAAPAATAGEVDPADDPGCVTSPMVGTVYLAAEPGAAPFVSVGDAVEAGQTLLIIEAMKTMNQIPSPRAGVVKKILVSNEQPIEFGAPLLILE